ncbi:MAG: GtrA family protein [Mycobacteriales bacterium]
MRVPLSATTSRLFAMSRTHTGIKMTRYLVASGVTTIASMVSFVALFGTQTLGSKGSALVSSALGTAVGYGLNRNWAWGKRGRSHPWKEILPYWITAVITWVVASLVTGWVNGLVRTHTSSHAVRTTIDAIAYLGTYGALFVIKYAVFDRLFKGGKAPAEAAEPSVVRGG